ncbi:YtxH domain-containing protein [Solitalea sp. MAHUQ-68]|uniref:YtxH domain-containing protein n=1 Tax=Solitalea agri TaxID=2953739 RepID=A0A9X2JCX8_9SPHI|nr:YtxH domain-containing protein [Solitalea agri]MCO4293004.1 YtxH domain-containing protein [Solitalea agri]
MNDNTKAMLAFFAGLAVGATLGILLAPEKGSDLRDKIGDSIKKSGDDLLSKINSGIESAKSRFSKTVHQASDELGV